MFCICVFLCLLCLLFLCEFVCLCTPATGSCIDNLLRDEGEDNMFFSPTLQAELLLLLLIQTEVVSKGDPPQAPGMDEVKGLAEKRWGIVEDSEGRKELLSVEVCVWGGL